MFDRWGFLTQKHKKRGWNNSNTKLLIYETCCHIYTGNARKIQKM